MEMALVEHAEQELALLGVDPAVRGTLVATVAAFASCSPSGMQHEHLVSLLTDLLARRPLSPLSANPAEWVDRGATAGAPLWQNRRDPRALSEDGGRTYRLTDAAGAPTYRSAAPRGWVLALQERDGVNEREAVAAVWEYLDSGPITSSDVQMLDALPAGALRWDYMKERWGPRGGAVAWLMYGSAAAEHRVDGEPVRSPAAALLAA
jgi:hypothetical protein